MKKLFIITIFLSISILGYSQETNKELLKKAETELSSVVEKEDYEKAAQLKNEIEIRKQIEEAVAEGDYQLAANLKIGYIIFTEVSKEEFGQIKAEQVNL